MGSLDILVYGWLAWLLLTLFVLGSIIGSFLNVCIARLPLGLSLLRPGSHCGHCHVPIRSSDNVPLLSYWRLHGRCRHCGAAFSMRYFWVELLTGLGFVALWWLEVFLNIHRYAGFWDTSWWYFNAGRFPPQSWPLYAFHVVMLCFLIVAVFCAVEWGRVPRGVVLGGLGVGLLGALLFPWPWPQSSGQWSVVSGQKQTGSSLAADRWPLTTIDWSAAKQAPRSGVYPWPVWGPLPAWLPPGSWQLGLATGLAGMLVGGGLMLLFRLCFADQPALRALQHGDVAVLLLAGSFLGWQPTVLVVLLGVALAIVAAVVGWPWRHRAYLSAVGPAGSVAPWLAVGILVAWLGWPWLGPCLYPVLFERSWVGILALALPASLGVFGKILNRLLAGA